MLGTGIALAFLPPDVEDGAGVEIDVRGSVVPATVTKPPFWTRDRDR
jgi:glycine cleavage system aminomethyltransferase T